MVPNLLLVKGEVRRAEIPADSSAGTDLPLIMRLR